MWKRSLPMGLHAVQWSQSVDVLVTWFTTSTCYLVSALQLAAITIIRRRPPWHTFMHFISIIYIQNDIHFMWHTHASRERYNFHTCFCPRSPFLPLSACIFHLSSSPIDGYMCCMPSVFQQDTVELECVNGGSSNRMQTCVQGALNLNFILAKVSENRHRTYGEMSPIKIII